MNAEKKDPWGAFDALKIRSFKGSVDVERTKRLSLGSISTCKEGFVGKKGEFALNTQN